MRHTPETNEVFPHNYYFEEGYLNVKDELGLGVDFDEKLVAKFPYGRGRAYFLINRKLDGTIIIGSNLAYGGRGVRKSFLTLHVFSQ